MAGSIAARFLFVNAAVLKDSSGFGFGHGFDRTQDENVTGNSNQQESACGGKGQKERVCCLHNIAGRNRSGNAGDLIAKVQDSADGAHAFFGRD